MNKKMLALLVADEIAACERMLRWIEDDYNSPARVAVRERIANHIGRPLCCDHVVSTKVDSVDVKGVLSKNVSREKIDIDGLLKGLDIDKYLKDRICETQY